MDRKKTNTTKKDMDFKEAGSAQEEETRSQFSAFCVSGFGELSPSAITMLDWLVDKRRSLAEKSWARADGVKPLELMHRLRMGIQMAIAAGSGERIHSAGQPWG